MLLGRLFLFLQNLFALHFKRNLHFRVETAVKGFTVRQSRAIVRGNNTSLIQTVSFANICWVICKASFMHFYGQPCTLMQHFFQHSQELCFSCSLSFSCVFFFFCLAGIYIFFFQLYICTGLLSGEVKCYHTMQVKHTRVFKIAIKNEKNNIPDQCEAGFKL